MVAILGYYGKYSCHIMINYYDKSFFIIGGGDRSVLHVLSS